MPFAETQFHQEIDNLYERVSAYWQRNSRTLLDGRCGYSIFGSKPYRNPPLLIVGLNPGFSAEDAKGGAHFDLVPTSSKFLEHDWSDFKAALVKLFEFDGGKELLNDAVATNLLLFKSNRLKGSHALSWSQVPAEARRGAEDFSRREFTNVLEILEPQRILVVGLDAADRTMEMAPLSDPTHLHRLKRRNHRLIVAGTMGGIPAVGICHITGSRISREDRANMTARLAQYFSQSSRN